MEKLQMCRICLVEKVHMFVVVNRNLHKLYQKLTDIPFITEDRRPMLACFFCCAKLKQCYRLLRKCLKAEELFTHMMNEDYEPNTLINQDHLEFYSGFIRSPIENISIVDVVQTESIAIKEELPAVCEGLDDIIEPKEEHQSDDLEYEVPLMEIKTEVEEEQELPAVCEGLDNIIEPKEEHQSDELELENLDNSCRDVADIRPHHSFVTYDVPLEFTTQVEEERAASTNKRRASETTRMGKSRAEYMRHYRRKKREEKLKTEKVKPKKIARNSTQRSRDFRARVAKSILSQTSTTDQTSPQLVVSPATLCKSTVTACNTGPAEIQPRPSDVEQE